MALYQINEELNGIEISFDEKPGTETISALKASGFRWHRTKKLWYAKQTEARLELVKALCEGKNPATIQPTTETATEDEQSVLKALYMDIVKSELWPKSDHMQDYCKKKAAYIIPLDNGDISVIDKPDIETRFCFGYGYCGVSTQEQEEDARHMADYAATSEEYFISENLKGLNQTIATIEDESMKGYKYLNYTNQKNGSHLKALSFTTLGNDPEYAPHMWSNYRDLEEITPEERESVLKAYQEVKKSFEKRLHTYLKRYGLSKVRTWSFLSD